jgi:hypothetical protein
MQWRPQDVRDFSRHLLRKATGNMGSQSKREVYGKAIEAGLHKTVGAHIMTSCAQDVRHKVT